MTLRLLPLCFLALLLAVPGCGPARPATVPVAGTLTYGGGPFPKGGTLHFNHVKAAPGFHLRPASADFGPDGKFTSSAWEGTAGLVPGTYTMRIECWEVPPSMESGGRAAKSYMPPSMPGGMIMENGKPRELVVEPHAEPIKLDMDIPKK